MTEAGRPPNVDSAVVQAFGDEWTRFDQAGVAEGELRKTFDEYFAVFPWPSVSRQAVGFDLGCGSGRWARFVAPRVGRLHCIDASAAAIDVARKNLSTQPNCEFHVASVDAIPLADASADFGYSLGVLHHVPDPAAGLGAAVAKLKTGAPFLLYLYYRFDNRPAWYRWTWAASDAVRRAISRQPRAVRYWLSQAIAAGVYWPLARVARTAEAAGLPGASFIPLHYYSRRSFYVMRNDALDRFGTRLERRFTRPEIDAMMRGAGLTDIIFSEAPPYWCAAGRKAR